ncbi:MAG: cell wall hydrolase [Salaquimonas sp.]|nr:cell wall hydrolase [Salaquimonas sp.]
MQRVRLRLAFNTTPLFAGIAVFLAYPNIIAFQDVASVAPAPVAQRWLAHVPEPAGNMVLATAIPSTALGRKAVDGRDIDAMTTGSVTMGPDTTGTVITPSYEISTEVQRGSQPQRINREGKGDRVVSATIKRPPAYFSAGSVLERHSMLEPRTADKEFELAFVKPRPVTEAYQVAAAFHPPKSDLPPVDPDLPVVVASLVSESADNVLAYAEDDKVVRSPFAAVLKDERPVSLVPKLAKGDHNWAADLLPMTAYSDRDQNCLTAGIYFEARGESVRGQAAVAQVILNRVKNPAYPNDICAVVYQNKKWRNRCQFSFACDGIRDRVRDRKSWELASYVARETTEGRIWLTEVGSSTHYHAAYVRPRWARHMKRVGRIGLHVFYRTIGGGWS